MLTQLRKPRSIETQKVADFTGEGAYHGSSQPRKAPPAPLPVPAEMQPTTLDSYLRHADGKVVFADFLALFPDHYRVLSRLPQPSQAQVRDDAVTLCWCPLEQALQAAGPLTRSVIEEMRRHLSGEKQHVYVDSKIQYFEAGDLPVDSTLWHIDGSIAVRDPRAQKLGYGLLHDMRARLESTAPPRFMAYLSSAACATEFVVEPVSLELPELVPDFYGLDRRVRALQPRVAAQPAGAIVGFSGLSCRPVPAQAPGWRLWVRCIETDRQVQLTSNIIDCYGSVFRRKPPTG